MKYTLLFFILISMTSISLISSLPNDNNNKLDFTYTTPTNYSSANVNNSEYFQGYTPTTLYNYFKGLFDLVYQPIGNYLTTWLIPDTTNGFLYNDSTKIYFNDSKLSTIFYNATLVTNITGISSGGLSDIQSYNGISYNVTETTGSAPGLDLRVNFSGITDFNSLIIRYKSSASENHIIKIQLYDYSSSSWEDYGYFSLVNTFEMKVLGVFDSSEHISGGVVQVRFLSESNGIQTHIHYFDWVEISKGYGTPSGQEVDPYWNSDKINYYNKTEINNTISQEGLRLGFNSTYNVTYDNKADYQFTNNNFNGSGNIITLGNIINEGNITTYGKNSELLIKPNTTAEIKLYNNVTKTGSVDNSYITTYGRNSGGLEFYASRIITRTPTTNSRISNLIFQTGYGDVLYNGCTLISVSGGSNLNCTGTIEAKTNFIVNTKTGITANYNIINITNSSCWMNFTGGILTSSTC